MKKIALAATAAALLSLGSVAIPTAAQAQGYVYVQQMAPPPPRFERMPPPRQGYVWVPGHHVWRGDRYIWARGTWIRARPGYAYRVPQWREHEGRWEYRRGDWERGHDRDRNRVPDRFDHRRD
ncbi:MAG: putative signal peptide protein, partial [Variovorax sp.]|nr:putative signal peptide protein [Variovorax sp.]